jgi:hypothetical protein
MGVDTFLQTQSIILVGSICFALTLLLFPRQVFMVVWILGNRLFKERLMPTEKGAQAHSLQQTFEDFNPRTRTDFYWGERAGALVMLVVLLGALIWLV